jgi:eukaryotic-like serine/threonine-protein kinase
MGEVYEARDEVLERDVAVKVLPAPASQDRRSLARLRREARAAAGLAHANVVAVHDLVVADGHAFIVMELVQGRSLSQMLGDGTPLLPPAALRIARDVAEALSYAHARGLTHRDIAPGNVIVRPGGGAKVLDFGLARAEDWTPAFDPSPSPRGTVAYISPEQVEGRRGDARSDVYSLGCVLYEMLTGRPPFEGPSPAAIAAQHVRAPVVPPKALCPEVPQWLDQVVLRCLMKEPRDRFSSGTELAAALREVGRSQRAARARPVRPPTHMLPTPPPPLATHRETTTRPARVSPRLRRWIVGVAATFVAGLLAIGVLPAAGLLIWPPRPDPLPRLPRPIVPPTGVVAQGICDGFLSSGVSVSWEPTASVANGYELYRSTSPNGAYEFVARVPGRDATSFRDAALGMGQTYYYVLRSVAGRRLSPLTEAASARTPLLCLG